MLTNVIAAELLKLKRKKLLLIIAAALLLYLRDLQDGATYHQYSALHSVSGGFLNTLFGTFHLLLEKERGLVIFLVLIIQSFLLSY